LELYAALEGVDYDPGLAITVTTLRDALYMNRVNDLSFLAGDKLILVVEHQSSINHNMPLRILLYLARVYEKIIDRRSLYREALAKIPRPECVVLYNGPEEAPEQWEQRLSDAFMEPGEGRQEWLDLRVQVSNINKGQNEAVLRRSERLAGYAEFVAKARENRETMPLNEAVTEAVRYCVKNGILTGFFEEHGSEVLNMLLDEWNLDEAKEVWREEVLEKGREEVRAELGKTTTEQDRTIQELRRKLQEAGIDPL
jgi:hypothetical protein